MWTRFDDSTPDHPKFAFLGDYAPLCGWLWFSACCYCMRYLTDGRIDLITFRRLWPYRHIGVATGGIMDPDGGKPLAEFGDDPTCDDLVTMLVSAKLLEEIEPGLYQIHDFLEYQLSRREVLQMRKRKVKAGQAGGQASAQARAQARSEHVGRAFPLPHSHSSTEVTTTSSEDVSVGYVQKRNVPSLVGDVLEKRRQELREQAKEAERIHKAKQGQDEPLPPQF